MNDSREHPLVALLLTIAGTAPQPWYHKAYAQQTGVDPEALDQILEWLWLEGLIDKAPAAADARPGIVLTPLGQQVAHDPAALERLRQGEPVSTGQGAVVRTSLRRPITPTITRLLLLANFLVFGYCLYLAREAGLMQPYLSSRADSDVVTKILHPAGGVSARDVLDGAWWRLLAACFVHAGVLHIGFNMYALHAAGRFVEQTWGHWRYVIIYFLAGWGGSCMALAAQPTTEQGVIVTVVGASGALCGVLAAEAVWILLNTRHLPRSLARQGRSQLLTTLILIVVISLIPGVSGWGHLGGALAGGAAALALHFQRFGPRLISALAWPVLLLIPVASYAHLQRARATSPAWQGLERTDFVQRFGKAIPDAMDQTMRLCEKELNPLLNQHPTRRDQAKVDALITALQKQQQDVANLLARIERHRNPAPEVAEIQQQAKAGLLATQELCEQAIGYLRAGEQAKRQDEMDVVRKYEAVDEHLQEWVRQLRQLQDRKK